MSGLRWVANLHRLENRDRAWDGAFTGSAASAGVRATDPRLVAFRQMWADAVADLVAAVADEATDTGEIAAR